MTEIAAYKGEGRLYDHLIRIWTRSPYSHVEIALGRTETHFRGLSASPRDGGVRVAEIEIKPDHWDFFEAEGNLTAIEPLVGARYDWKGIFLSQILPFGLDSPSRYFCSELAAVYLGLPKPQSYSPRKIVDYLRGRK